MKSTIEGRSVRQKMTTSDLKTVENACDEALRWEVMYDCSGSIINARAWKHVWRVASIVTIWPTRWLEMHQGADLEELQERRKVAEAACGPCITRLYQVCLIFAAFSTSFTIAFSGIWGNNAWHGWVEHGWAHLQRRRRRKEEKGQGEEALSLAPNYFFTSQFCGPP